VVADILHAAAVCCWCAAVASAAVYRQLSMAWVVLIQMRILHLHGNYLCKVCLLFRHMTAVCWQLVG
jgi:hypothetical protein